MSHLDIKLFGPFEVRLNGKMINGFRSNKARALLAYLAIEANRPVARTRLATLLWGDYPDVQARKSLRNVLANLRDLFSPLFILDQPILTIDRQTAQLSIDNQQCAVDTVRFDELLRAAASAVSASSTNAYLTQAMTLYHADMLAGLDVIDSTDFEAWRVVQQEQRHRQALSALTQITAYQLDQGDFMAAASHARRQLELEPWQEQAHRQLIHALAAQGDRPAALAQFESCRQLLQQELGIAPDMATLELAEAIRQGTFAIPNPTTNQLLAITSSSATTSSSSRQQGSTVDYAQPPTDVARILSRLDPLPDQLLFGVATLQQRLLDLLLHENRPWLVALDGIGGIGKTTLATVLVHELVKTERFAEIAWVSAKQQEFRAAVGIAETGRPALDVETLTTTLLAQVMAQPPLTASSVEKQQILHELLHERSILVVVDNLESIVDYQVLVPYLRQLANPSKFLITSRFTLQSYSDVFCYSLTELTAPDALAFLRHEAAVRNNTRLGGATDKQLQTIYAVVGGNPLALKLVIGQLTFLPLDQVLDNLRNARCKRIDQLYTYIYWQAWQMLTETSRKLFLSLPLMPNGTFAQLALISELDSDDLQEGLAQLSALSLVQTGGDLHEPRYRLHRLTETFLMNEVLKWR